MRRSRPAPQGAALLCLVLGAGCAAGPPLEARLQPWIGRGEADLVANFGVPVRTYLVEDRKFLQFEERRTQLVPGPDPFFYRPYGRFGPLAAPSPAAILVGCDVTFALRRGVVESFSFRGDACR